VQQPASVANWLGSFISHHPRPLHICMIGPVIKVTTTLHSSKATTSLKSIKSSNIELDLSLRPRHEFRSVSVSRSYGSAQLQREHEIHHDSTRLEIIRTNRTGFQGIVFRFITRAFSSSIELPVSNNLNSALGSDPGCCHFNLTSIKL